MLMKQCGWCLLLGKERVFNIRQLREHFDTDTVAGYLLGGVLEQWLSEAGEKEILSRVKKIDHNGDVAGQLEFIFGVRPEKKPEAVTPASEKVKKAISARNSFPEAAGSFPKSSFGAGSFSVGSFRAGSFRTGSFRAGSSAYFKLISFGRSGSFRMGSGFAASFRYGYGYGFGSGYGKGSGSGRGSGKSSFAGIPGSGGSFRYYAGNSEITEEEYHRTLINLSSCPLNEYGYGIHLI